ncbi:MAG: hydrogenase maturation protease [Anaerolineales bacterium]|jgi:hydrogenase maturation protease
MKTLVLGLGNPILGDDGVGLVVVDRLRPLLENRPDVELGEDYWGGLRLMERLVGFDRAIIIDAIVSGQPVGTVLTLSPGSVPTQRSSSSHDVNLSTALKLGRQTGSHLPSDENIKLIAIEAGDVYTFTEQLSPEVEAAIPSAIQAALDALDAEREAS